MGIYTTNAKKIDKSVKPTIKKAMPKMKPIKKK